jgi:hypothetical protein
MANKEHLAILRQGVEAWNRWREKNPTIRPDLSVADLIRANLSGANLMGADLSVADLSGANLLHQLFQQKPGMCQTDIRRPSKQRRAVLVCAGRFEVGGNDSSRHRCVNPQAR